MDNMVVMMMSLVLKVLMLMMVLIMSMVLMVLMMLTNSTFSNMIKLNADLYDGCRDDDDVLDVVDDEDVLDDDDDNVDGVEYLLSALQPIFDTT